MSGLDRRRGPYLTVVKDGGRPLLGDGSRLWAPEPALPEEHHQDSPERRLLAAVLEEGIRTIQHGPPESRSWHSSGQGRYLVSGYESACRWLWSDDTAHLYAFRSICSYLGLNADWVRRHVPEARRPHRHLHALAPTHRLKRPRWNP